MGQRGDSPKYDEEIDLIVPGVPVALGVGAEGALHARAPRKRNSEARSRLGQAHVPVACFGVPSRVGAPSPDPAHDELLQRLLKSRCPYNLRGVELARLHSTYEWEPETPAPYSHPKEQGPCPSQPTSPTRHCGSFRACSPPSSCSPAGSSSPSRSRRWPR